MAAYRLRGFFMANSSAMVSRNASMRASLRVTAVRAIVFLL